MDCLCFVSKIGTLINDSCYWIYYKINYANPSFAHVRNHSRHTRLSATISPHSLL